MRTGESGSHSGCRYEIGIFRDLTFEPLFSRLTWALVPDWLLLGLGNSRDFPLFLTLTQPSGPRPLPQGRAGVA